MFLVIIRYMRYEYVGYRRKPNKSGNVQISFTVKLEDIEMFERLYPHLSREFFRRCVNRAINSRDYFDLTWFNDSFQITSRNQVR